MSEFRLISSEKKYFGHLKVTLRPQNLLAWYFFKQITNFLNGRIDIKSNISDLS